MHVFRGEPSLDFRFLFSFSLSLSLSFSLDGMNTVPFLDIRQGAVVRYRNYGGSHEDGNLLKR